eukprot:460807_1
MSPLQSLLAYLCLLFQNAQSNQNLYTKLTGSNGEDIWKSTSWFQQSGAISYGTIKIGQVMVMEFDFRYLSRVNSPTPGAIESFFRIGHTGTGGGCSEGTRYPSLWLDDNTKNDNGFLTLSYSSGDTCAVSKTLWDYGQLSRLADDNIWTHIIITIDWTTVTIELTGGEKVDKTYSWNREITKKADLGDEVPVWFGSDGGWNIGNCKLRNIVITSSVFTYSPTPAPTKVPTHTSHMPSLTPTNNPTQSPTHVPSGYPSSTPTTNPTQSPSHVPSGHPSSTPTKNPTLVPSSTPTESPTDPPTNIPSTHPSSNPTITPTEAPSNVPSIQPSSQPSASPTTGTPTVSPIPTTAPPTEHPSTQTPSTNPITAHPTVSPTFLQVLYESTTAVSDDNGDGEEDHQDNDDALSSLPFDGVTIGIIVAVCAVGCCIVMGAIILQCKKNSDTTDMDEEEGDYTKEMDGPDHLNINVQQVEMQRSQKQEMSPVYTPDGVVHQHVIKEEHAQYLSVAQKRELYNQLKGPRTDDPEECQMDDDDDDIYAEPQADYLSAAQREELMKHGMHTPEDVRADKEENEHSSDDDVVEHMQTSGKETSLPDGMGWEMPQPPHADMDRMKSRNEGSEGSNAIEHKMTIGMEEVIVNEGDDDHDEYDVQYDDDEEEEEEAEVYEEYDEEQRLDEEE